MTTALEFTPIQSIDSQRPSGSVPDPVRRLAALRAPLAVKVVGANLLVVAILVAAWRASGLMRLGDWEVVGGAAVIHLILVIVALRPIRDLDAVAARVWNGDYAARVRRSAVADEDVLRVGAMFNILLDSLAADRTRVRALASQVIATGEIEQAKVARELHDSIAQHLAALMFQLSATSRDCNDPAVATRLAAARDDVRAITEEVRNLSQAIRPSVLDELGLVPALERLVRETTRGTGIDADVHSDFAPASVPPKVASVLYRVAEEAMRNALLHAAAERIRISLHGDAHVMRMEVSDDGVGFDPAIAEPESGAVGGLASMRERLSLADGTLEIKSASKGGTTIIATVPLEPTRDLKPTRKLK